MVYSIIDQFTHSSSSLLVSLYLFIHVAPFTNYTFAVSGVTEAGEGPATPDIPFSLPEGSTLIKSLHSLLLLLLLTSLL